MAEKALTCTFLVGGKPVEKLTTEQIDKMARLVGETLSTYYTTRPEEYKNIKTEPRQRKTRQKNNQL